MAHGPRVIVAGAGALGLNVALALADAGCAVTVCDPAKAPQASSVAAGMLAPVFETVLDGGDDADLDLLLSARNLWPALAARAGVEVDRSGTAAVGSAAWLAPVRAGLTRLGFRGADLPSSLLMGLAPGVSADVEALFLREDWRLDPRQALKVLRQAAEAVGVAFKAQAVRERGDADWLVIATGAAQGLADVAPELHKLTPIKGQILRYADRRGGRVSLRGEGAYAVPGADGLAIGATMEPGRDDAEPDAASLAPLVAAAARLFPELAGATFGVSAGVRAASPDGRPLVGASVTPGVILAVGARRNGWLLSPLVARIVTAQVTGADPGPYATRFDPARFAA
ncbi:FAD-dependent oxidoreductase [Phenylobacterium sp.]|jgi:glycine oxidase|uniref:NAD(P)/FAD-dependent oxidoreductase n=1 Tax=Phenylobacterium sp. TaxID=1871053 RepID=UPI002E33F396|nr:FAD-dependent oxidoreductase [Phenylobacterium sp.]HEX3367795.1 FAD-dependent oxidoreductase [Phenylobacterium sp.]